MANEPTDFLRLYQELGLVPGASLEDLRRAYRRRVSELHPDRSGQSCTASLPGAAERLQRITVLYGAATQFYRQHGRLPASSIWWLDMKRTSCCAGKRRISAVGEDHSAHAIGNRWSSTNSFE